MSIKKAWVYDAKIGKGKIIEREMTETSEPDSIELQKEEYSKLLLDKDKLNYLAKKLGVVE